MMEDNNVEKVRSVLYVDRFLNRLFFSKYTHIQS